MISYPTNFGSQFSELPAQYSQTKMIMDQYQNIPKAMTMVTKQFFAVTTVILLINSSRLVICYLYYWGCTLGSTSRRWWKSSLLQLRRADPFPSLLSWKSDTNLGEMFSRTHPFQIYRWYNYQCRVSIGDLLMLPSFTYNYIALWIQWKGEV